MSIHLPHPDHFQSVIMLYKLSCLADNKLSFRKPRPQNPRPPRPTPAPPSPTSQSQTIMTLKLIIKKCLFCFPISKPTSFQTI